MSDKPKTASVTINASAKEQLAAYAAGHGVSLRTYLEALAHFAISCERRPGSWEANRSFEFSTYDERHEVVADRWF